MSRKTMFIQTSDSKPYTVSVMRQLAAQFPYIIQRLGGYNYRYVHGTHTLSDHSFGRAIDIYLDVSYPQEKKLGELLYAMFKTYPVELKTHHVIFNWLEWYVGTTADGHIGAKEERGPHTNHVHIDFVDQGMNDPAPQLSPFLVTVDVQMRRAGFADWMDGLYGPAFNPAGAHDDRLTPAQRQAIYDMNMQIYPMTLAPAYTKARDFARDLVSKRLIEVKGKAAED